MAGRKPKLTPEVRDTIARLIAAGNYVNVAAEAAGIHVATFYRWLSRGEPQRRPTPAFRDFATAITRARVEAEASMVRHLTRAAAAGNWQAAAFWLERTRRDRWGRSVAPAPTVPPSALSPSVTLDLSLLTVDELELLRTVLEQQHMQLQHTRDAVRQALQMRRDPAADGKSRTIVRRAALQ
jgi:hypothetical protein